MFRREIRNKRFTFGLIAGLGLVFSTMQSAQAGVIPWTYNAIFGYGPIFNGGMSGRGMGYQYPPVYYGAPAYPEFSAPMPMTSYYHPYSFTQNAYYGGGIAWGASYGGLNCDACGTCTNTCSPCGTGNCASGNCSSGYTPATTPSDNEPRLTPQDDKKNPEPTQTVPPRQLPPDHFEPDQQGGGFRPTTPRENDQAVPQSTIPGGGQPQQPSPNTSVTPGQSTIPLGQPGQYNPNRSTVPQSSPFPSDSGTPPTFQPPTPAPGEPGSGNSWDDILPDGAGVQPMSIPFNPIAKLKVKRERVTLDASYVTPEVARLKGTPVQNTSEDETQVARK